MSLEIGRLTVEDVEDARHLSTQAGWNQTRADWRRLIELFPETCFAGRVEGELVATSTLADYDGSVAWIGMVLVEEAHRRRGYGSRIFERALDAALDRDVEVVGLDATDAGAAVYEQYGFEAVAGIDRWEGVLSVPPDSPDAGEVREATSPGEIRAFDARQVGADRGPLLAHVLRSQGSTGFVLDAGDEVAGYAIVRPGRTCGQVGPIVGRDFESASTLLAGVAGHLDDRVIADVLRDDRTRSLFESAGFAVQRRLNRMTYRDPEPMFVNDGVVAAAGFEWG